MAKKNSKSTTAKKAPTTKPTTVKKAPTTTPTTAKKAPTTAPTTAKKAPTTTPTTAPTKPAKVPSPKKSAPKSNAPKKVKAQHSAGNSKEFTPEQRERIDKAMHGRPPHHVVHTINNAVPGRTAEISQRIAFMATYQIWDDEIIVAIEKANDDALKQSESNEISEAAKADDAATSAS